MRIPTLGEKVLYFPSDGDEVLIEMAVNADGVVIGVPAIVAAWLGGVDHQVNLEIVGDIAFSRARVPYSDNETSLNAHWCWVPEAVYDQPVAP